MDKVKFGTTKNNEEIMKFTLKNKKGVKVSFINYGAIITNIIVPDKNGTEKDIVLGYDNLADYETNSSFFGALVGPNANRLANASYEIDGVKYELKVNDKVSNNLHSDMELGFHKRVWDYEEGENSVSLRITVKDLEMGFGGNKEVKVTYSLNEESEFKAEYEVRTDKKTIINLTNHSYFNLAGHDGENIENMDIELKASNYVTVDENLIPFGKIENVKNTPFDFLNKKRIGKDINCSDEQLIIAGGYDHNFCIDNYDGNLRECATAYSDKTGIKMVVYTSLPGIQIYTGNYIDEQLGKANAKYGRRQGVCFETQYYPDTIHHANFPQNVFDKEKPYHEVTVFKFEKSE